ncbi:FAD-dependent oxidoreductase [Cohnella sp. JJ-181]|uniref:FAD-dependent oxidoreductase n=1 Tax=Cohnella rhizoplanae TaxID=2974897 RepID=UPI0022FF50EA|nr:FAD-dependent oxidoreductase [Cohnella sp. JJ-181]CAI6050244.1 Nitric oxide reductase FlRd-NAD(+) reductase [Cohnella sp. JJ-181]
MAKKPRLVLVGNGMAGIRCLEEIVGLAPDAFDVTVIGKEPNPNYNRIQLSKVLQGGTSLQDIILNDWSWYAERGIRLLAGETAVRVRTGERTVDTASGLSVGYDKLILATGSSAFVPPLPGAGKPGVTAFRTIEDCREIMEAASRYRKAAVLGGGLLGLEAARGLLNLGMEVDVVHNSPYLMNRQLDRMSADMLRGSLEAQGMRFRLGKTTTRIFGRKRAEGLLFADGSKLEADLIVLSVGISPNIAFAKASGIETNRAVIVNDYMETNVPGVYAVGECAEHRGIAYGLVAPLYEQGKVLARVVCGMETEPYLGSMPYAQLKVAGINVFSAGVVREGDASTVLQAYDGLRGTYKRVTAENGRIAGVVLYGDTNEGQTLLGHLKRRSKIEALARSPQPGGAGGGGAVDAAAAAMADADTVCGCNGVCKGAIVRSVTEDGSDTIELVRERTKASSSCGGCSGTVAAILRAALSGAASAAAPDPALCDCTPLGHRALRRALAERGLRTGAEAMAALDWRTDGGCEACRSALRYYTGEPSAAVGEGRLAVYAGDAQGSGGPGAGPAARLAEALSARLADVELPGRVQAAVAGSVAEPVGLLVRDIGLARAPAGWELYAGGHAERPVRQAQLIAVEPSADAALDMAEALLRWYRAEADYGEPLWRWLERGGLSAARERLLDAEAREALLTAEATVLAR